jgi:hypothetical protein
MDHLITSSIVHVTITRKADAAINSLYRKALESKPRVTDMGTDTVQVSYLLVLNACGSYTGSVQLENDSLILYVIDKSEESCASQSIFELGYTIVRSSKWNVQRLGIKRRWTGMDE